MTVLCSETSPNAKPETVGSNANRPVTQQNDRKLKNDFDD
jgi:hypothetical protein